MTQGPTDGTWRPAAKPRHLSPDRPLSRPVSWAPLHRRPPATHASDVGRGSASSAESARSSRGHVRSAKRDRDLLKCAWPATPWIDATPSACSPWPRSCAAQTPRCQAECRLGLSAGRDARDARPYPGTRRSRCSPTARSMPTTNAANAEVVREMMARGMCALTGARDAARRLAPVLRARQTSWESRSTAAATPTSCQTT